MALVDIIILGYTTNVILNLLFMFFTIMISVVEAGMNPKKILEIRNFENNLAELKRLLEMAPFQEKYSDLFAFLIPFASVLKCYTLVNGILREGSLPAYVEFEILRLRRVIEDSRKENER